ncbi:MAG: marine proteobacterial sortase target protein [Rhizobiales bacterium]|nr:marine proteobacterial sortase target protein [Hyphomicrobiales bacterium]
MAISLFGEARAAERQLAFVTPNDMKSGSLLLKSTEGGKYLEAPKLATDYTVTVSGPTARTIVTQRFENPAAGWVEGVYVFPLPENSAVDTLKIVAGNRVLVGTVKERQEAKQVYEEAKAQGQTAALLEQERPNLFTNSVANIGPGETVVVQIEYQEAISQSTGVFSLRLPLVAAPRYMPAPLVQSVDFSGERKGFGTTVNDPVPDRDRISPPVLNPKTHGPINPVSITVNLNAGFALGEVKSHHHQVAMTTIDPQTRRISLDGGDVPADKDFELTWTASGDAPQAGLFKETVNGQDYLLGFVTPPGEAGPAVVAPREIIFVIDNSGSMDGPSMVQAKDSLIHGLNELKPTDRFNVIRFDDTYDVLFRDAVDANRVNIINARNWVSNLSADGGTEMLAPMEAALRDSNPSGTATLRQVVFLTDGAVANEQQLFEMISKGRGRSRVFMVGIGSAPNSYLMTRAAELGRGTFTHIGDGAQVTARMAELFNKLGNPAVTDLRAAIDGSTVKLTPDMLPDLYRGEPVTFMAEGKTIAGTIKITGMIGKQPWEVSLPLANAAPGSGISKLWARRRIADFEVASTLGQMSYEDANKQVLAMALAHQIVSSQTSLIAVDKSPKRPAGERLSRADVPLNLPAGWTFEKVFGEESEPVKTIEERDASIAYKQLAVLTKPPVAVMTNQVNLPQTATPAALFAILSAMMMLAAAALRFVASRSGERA